MPPVNVRFHEEAAAEVEAARQWYAERSLPAAEAFRAEIDLAVERVRNGLSDGRGSAEALVDIYYPGFLSA